MSNSNLSLHEICGRIINGETELFKILELSDKNIIIANFMQAKEFYIEKERHGETSYTLHFDYDYSKDVLWDIYFLGNYIYNKSDPKTREEIKRKADSAVGGGYNFSGISFDFKNLPNGFSDSEIKKLKRAIIAVQKVRDTFGHSEVNVNNGCLELRNYYSSSRLVCDLPIKYLQYFSSGIIPNTEDKDIASACTSAVEKYGTLTHSANYHVPPSNLKRINDLIESEVQRKISLGEIPDHLLTINSVSNLKKIMAKELFNKVPLLLLKTSEDRFNSLVTLVNSNFDKLVSLPRFMYYANYSRFENLLEKHSLEYLTTYPEGALVCNKEKLDRILEILENDIDRLKRISNRVFGVPLELINYLYNLVEKDVEKFVNLPSKIYEFSVSKLKYFVDDLGLTIDQLVNLNEHFINCSKSKIVSCLKLVDNDPTRLNEVVLFATTKEFTPEELEYFQTLTKEEFALISSLYVKGNKFLLVKNESILFTIKCGIKNNWDYVKLDELVKKISKSEIDFIKYIYELAHYNIDTLLKIPDGLYIYNGNKLDFLLSYINNDLSRLSEFEQKTNRNLRSHAIFDSKCDVAKLKFLLSYVNNEPSRLSEMPIFIFSDECTIERIKFLLKYIKSEFGTEDITKLKGITLSAFTCSEERLILLYELGGRKIESLYGLSTFLFGDTVSDGKIKFVLDYSKDGTGKRNFSKIKKIPWYVYSASYNRITLIMNLIGNDITLIDTVPKELFLCNDDTLVRELYQQYSENMIKSIFGISDEKTIALMLYMNSIFREKGVQSVNYRSFKLSDLDLSSMNISNMNGNLKKIITSMLNKMCSSGTLKKIEDVENLQLSNIDDPNNEFNRTITLQNKELFRFLRNCSEHFCVWPIGNDNIKLVDGGMVCTVNVSVLYNLINEFYKGEKDLSFDEWQNELITRASMLKGSFTPDLYSSKWNTEYPELMIEMSETDVMSVKQKLSSREQSLATKKAEIRLQKEQIRRNEFVKKFVATRESFNELKRIVGYNNILNDLYIKLQYMRSIGLEDVIIFKVDSDYKISYKYNGERICVLLSDLWNTIVTNFGEPENLEPVIHL